MEPIKQLFFFDIDANVFIVKWKYNEIHETGIEEAFSQKQEYKTPYQC